MKKSIEMPIVNVVRFEAKDVITTSCTIRQGIKNVNQDYMQNNVNRVAESKGFGGGISFSAAW